jgi:hypothetical protein
MIDDELFQVLDDAVVVERRGLPSSKLFLIVPMQSDRRQERGGMLRVPVPSCW